MSVRIHAALVFAPGRIQEKYVANYLCIGFALGGTVSNTELSESFGPHRIAGRSE